MNVLGQNDSFVELDCVEESAQLRSAERRRHERFSVAIPGKLFDPVLGTTFDCLIVDLSAGGAGVQCETKIVHGSLVVLYVDGFGRFDGVCVRNAKGRLGIRFTCGEEKRQRLSANLVMYIKDGITDPTRLRAHEREGGAGLLFLTRPGGECVVCEVIDISLSGLSLKTKLRPPIGELVQVGKSRGRVVRHHSKGVGLELVSIGDGLLKTVTVNRRGP